MAIVRDWDPNARDIIINCGVYYEDISILALGGSLIDYKAKTIVSIVYWTTIDLYLNGNITGINEGMKNAKIVQIGKSDPWDTDIDLGNLPTTRTIGFVKLANRYYIGVSYGGNIYVYWTDNFTNPTTMILSHPNTIGMFDYHNGAIDVFSGIPVGNTSLYGHEGVGLVVYEETGDISYPFDLTRGTLIVTYDNPNDKQRYFRFMIVDLPSRTDLLTDRIYEITSDMLHIPESYGLPFAGLVLVKDNTSSDLYDSSFLYYFACTNEKEVSIKGLMIWFSSDGMSWNTNSEITHIFIENLKMAYYQPISLVQDSYSDLIILTAIGKTTARYDGMSTTDDQFSTYLVLGGSDSQYNHIFFEDPLPSSTWRPAFISCISSTSYLTQLLIAPTIITHSDCAILHTFNNTVKFSNNGKYTESARITEKLSFINEPSYDHLNSGDYPIPVGSTSITNHCRYHLSGYIPYQNSYSTICYLFYGMHNTKISGYDDLNWRPLISVVNNEQLLDSAKKLTAIPVPTVGMIGNKIQEYIDYRDITNPGLPNNSQMVNRVMVSSSTDSKKLEEIKIGTVESQNEKILTNDINNPSSR